MKQKLHIPEDNIYRLGEDATFDKLPADKNHIVCSAIRYFEDVETSRGYSLKITLRGTETYFLGDKRIDLVPDQVFLVNKNSSYISLIDSNEKVLGVCFYFSEKCLHNVLNDLTQRDTKKLDEPLKDFFNWQGFPELLFPQATSGHWHLFRRIAQDIATGHTTGTLQEELFYYLAASAVQASGDVMLQLDRLNSKKLSTRMELLRRLNLAKNYIDDSPAQNPGISELSEIAMMSDFHFIRSFKQAFGLSPHQYHNKCRMEKAAFLISRRKNTISEIAAFVGFPDVHSFSACFKKYFGSAPSLWTETN